MRLDLKTKKNEEMFKKFVGCLSNENVIEAHQMLSNLQSQQEKRLKDLEKTILD